MNQLFLRSFLFLAFVFSQSAHAQSVSVPGRLVEFYNSVLDHYFYTTKTTGEMESIDSGAAGPGWSRTGIEFETAGINQFTQTLIFFRFYGHPTIGPNSHFYTTDVNEANFLRELQARTPATEKRWNYEGTLTAPVFRFLADTDPIRVLTPGERGCFIPTSANLKTSRIVRYYNEGLKRGVDSNHRFVYELDQTSIDKMTEAGWRREGITFCVLRVFRNNVEQK